MQTNNNHLIILLSFLIFLFSCSDNAIVKPVAKNGEINLTNWNFEKNGAVSLTGDWQFYWNQFIDPTSKTDSITTRITGYYHVPLLWSGSKINNDLPLSKGFATYKLKIMVSKPELYSFSLREILTAYRFYVNGELLATNGTAGKTKAESAPDYVPKIVTTQFKAGENIVILHVSNFFHREGGVFNPIWFGKQEQILQKKERDLGYDIFLIGAMAIIGIYHFFLFGLRRKDKSNLLFGIYSLIIAIRMLSTGEQYMSVLFPNLPWEWGYKIDHWTFYLGVCTSVTFLYTLFSEEIKKWAAITSIIISTCYSVFVLFTDAIVYSHFILYFHFVTVTAIIYSLSGLIKAMRRKREGAAIILSGIVVLFITVINDILYSRGTLYSIEMVSIGMLILVFSQSFVISMRFAKSFKQTEELKEELNYKNLNLEKIVKERTAEIMQQKEEILSQSEQLELSNRELEKLSIVASETDNAVIIMDEKGNFEWVNDAFSKLYGMNFDQLIAKMGTNMIESSRNPNIKETIGKCIETKKSVYYEMPAIGKNGNNIWVQTTLTPIINQEGEIRKFVAIDSDITEIKNAEKEIRLKNDEISQQRDLLERRNEDIKGSIRYAMTIQNSILPSKADIDKHLESFILYLPKDIVSGDFYWYTEISEERRVKSEESENSEERRVKSEESENSEERKVKGEESKNSEERRVKSEESENSEERRVKSEESEKSEAKHSSLFTLNSSLTAHHSSLIIAIVDCTGHGVPGAFMSLIGSQLLKEIINEHKIYSPAQILESLNDAIRFALKQDETENKDGMDISLCLIEKLSDTENRIVFSGAKNALYFNRIGNENIETLKANRKSIGGVKNSKNLEKFTNQELILAKGSTIYMSTDGFIDQNNAARKRFGTTKFVEMLTSLTNKPLDIQKQEIEQKLEVFKEGESQRDDITLLGIKL